MKLLDRFRKLDLYELQVCDCPYWRRRENAGNVIFMKDIMKDYTIILDKLGNPKSMEPTRGSYYIDMISGRVVSIYEAGDDVILEPSGIKIAKEHFKRGKEDDLLEKAVKIGLENENQYIETAEDLEYNTYFCNLIANREGLDEIPLVQVEQEIERLRKEYHEQINYCDRFYQSPFSCYDFVCLFSSMLASQKRTEFNRDMLIEFIASCKKKQKFNRILSDIEIKSNGVFPYSPDLDEAIQKLKIMGIFYTISPEKDASLYIDKGFPMAEMMEKRMAYLEDMADFVHQFKKYEGSITETPKQLQMK